MKDRVPLTNCANRLSDRHQNMVTLIHVSELLPMSKKLSRKLGKMIKSTNKREE